MQSCGVAELERTTYLGQRAIEDSLSDLQAQRLVIPLADGLLALTAQGQEACAAIARRSEAFSQEKLAGVAPADVDAARRVLETLLQR